jgi:hypothetical protein
MADLDRWLVDQIEGRKVEPSSGLGQATLHPEGMRSQKEVGQK